MARKRSWWCRVGLHDFELLCELSDAEIIGLARRELEPAPEGCIPAALIRAGRIRRRRVCVRPGCGYAEDEIEPVMRRAREAARMKRVRKLRAKFALAHGGRR